LRIRVNLCLLDRGDRNTIKDADAMEVEEAAKLEEEMQRKEMQKQVTRDKLKEEIQRDIQADKAAVEDEDIAEINDEEDAEAEYQAWKQRELQRIKRDLEEREMYVYRCLLCWKVWEC